MAERIANPKINAIKSFYLPNNRRKIKAILRRISKEIWSDVLESKEMTNLFSRLVLLPDEEKLPAFLVVHAKCSYYGYPYSFSFWVEQFHLKDCYKYPFKLTDKNVSDAEQILQKVFDNVKIDLDTYVQRKENLEKVSNNKFTRVDELYNNEEGEIEEILPDKEVYVDTIFGCQSNFNIIQLEMKKQKIKFSVTQLKKFIDAQKNVNPKKLYQYSAEAALNYIESRKKTNLYNCVTVIIENPKTKLLDLLDNRRANFIIVKNNLNLAIPRCKMKINKIILGNVHIFTYFGNIEEILEKCNDIVSSTKGYPIFGTISFIKKEKFGWYIVSKIVENITPIEIIFDEKPIKFMWPKIKLNKTPIFDANGLSIAI